MHRFFPVAVLLMAGIGARSAHAEIRFLFERGSFSLKIKNTGNETAGIGAFQVECAIDCLDPSSWDGISKKYDRDPAGVIAILGSGAQSFDEIVSSSSIIFEGSVTEDIFLSPGTVVDLGTVFTLDPCDNSDSIRYSFLDSGKGGAVREQSSSCIPEPNGMIFFALGGLATTIVRRRFSPGL